MTALESQLEHQLIDKLDGLKYTYRPDIRDRPALEANFRKHFEFPNRVTLTDGEFKRLLDEIVTTDVFAAATRLSPFASAEKEGDRFYTQRSTVYSPFGAVNSVANL